ncbi:MAG: DUF349 domain-containing protein [Gammaproteobacteria bacterium]|nr:DUF349 domain-containing protein [Gammaproteobacteria bacterium]MYG66530.1 DUF349 domain-containing protein [Gammaproteobacteria bacterium]
MDPEKHSAEAVGEMAPPPAKPEHDPEEIPSVEGVMHERDAITLHQELAGFLERKGNLDEHQAKRLRKSWDTLSAVLKEDSPMRRKLDGGFETLRDRIHRQVEERNREFAELEQQVEQLKQSLESNDLNTSQQLEQKIINGLNRIRGLSAQRRQKVIGDLEALQPKIKKLASWKNWGNEQAREKIIDEIRNIHDHETDLGKIAKRIQQAREEWKQWDLSDEGGGHKLYAVFDSVCTKSYEPCKEHFENLRKQRQAASRNRAQVCETLEKTYEDTDWRNPDWKAIQQLIREQTVRWRKLGSADYRDRKPLARRFEAIVSRFEGPLERERKRNLKQRRELIEQVQGLAGMEDSRKAMSELQVLKKQWRVTVSGSRKQEQAAWNRYTEACDSVYKRDKASKKAFERQLAEQLEVKKKLCAEIEAMVGENPSDPEDVETRLKRWKTAWEEGGRVPKHQEKQIQKRYRDAMGTARKFLSGLRRAAQSTLNAHLFRRAAACAELEAGILDGSSPDVDARRADFDVLPSLADDLQGVMEARFQAAAEAVNSDTKLNELRESLDRNFERINGYLLQLEINAGVDSPAAYAKQRMALQIGRLSAALGKEADQELLENQALVERIHTTGAVSASQQVEINQRFEAGYQALYSPDPQPQSS